MMGNTFSKTVDLLHRAMDVNLLRRDVYANNLSNVGVKDFKRTEVNFEEELRKALTADGNKPSFEMARTDPDHISSLTASDYRDVQPRRVLDYTTTYLNNGNNVDPEKEVRVLMENQLQYNLLAQAETFEFAQINLVLRS
jgi:flagellar basal-body rod protein FlgB